MTAEGDLVKAILSFLAMRGVFAWRNNTGRTFPTYKNKTGVTKKYSIKYGKVGSGDVFAVLSDGRFMTIEAKVKNNTQSPEQIEFMETVNAAGGLAIVARNLDDVADALLDAIE